VSIHTLRDVASVETRENVCLYLCVCLPKDNDDKEEVNTENETLAAFVVFVFVCEKLFNFNYMHIQSSGYVSTRNKLLDIF